MTKDDNFATLVKIISLGLEHTNKDSKDSAIKNALDGMFETRYHARRPPKDSFRDAHALKDDGVP